MKAEADTRARFTDYLEMSMLESINGDTAGSADDLIGGAGNSFGTEGLFAAIEDRGN